MSHITTYGTVLMDLECLRKALEEFPGATLAENIKEVAYFSGNKAKTNEQGQAVEHVIRIPETGYEIGLFKQKEGGWRLGYDAWDGKMDKRFGNGLNTLREAYAEQVIRKKAKATGHTIHSIRSQEQAAAFNRRYQLSGAAKKTYTTGRMVVAIRAY